MPIDGLWLTDCHLRAFMEKNDSNKGGFHACPLGGVFRESGR